MPIYQYLCNRCNSKFELKQSFSDESSVTCPRCHNGARRLFTPVPIIFKGSGFYVTDNAASNSSLRADANENKNETSEAKNTDSQ